MGPGPLVLILQHLAHARYSSNAGQIGVKLFTDPKTVSTRTVLYRIEMLRHRMVFWLPKSNTWEQRSRDLDSGFWVPSALLLLLGSRIVQTDHTFTQPASPPALLFVAPTRKLLKTRLAFHLLGHFWVGAHFTRRCLPKLPWNTERGMRQRLIPKLPDVGWSMSLSY